MFDKILVPVDGSGHSDHALHEALKLANIVGGTVALLHVVPLGSSYIISQKQEALYEIQQQSGEKILSLGEKAAEAEGIKVDKLLLRGDIVENIVRTAKEGNFKLIVIGARGLSKLKELLIGSVSDGVVRNASCPVLIVR